MYPAIGVGMYLFLLIPILQPSLGCLCTSCTNNPSAEEIQAAFIRIKKILTEGGMGQIISTSVSDIEIRYYKL
jgi:hypothetical protein